jgi:hypothetical protein
VALRRSSVIAVLAHPRANLARFRAESMINAPPAGDHDRRVCALWGVC